MRKANNNKYLKGEIIILTEGEYSGYGILSPGLAKVLKDFYFDKLAKQYLTMFPAQDDCLYDFSDFTKWLISEKYLKAIDYNELHVGSYGTLRVRNDE